MGNRRPLSSFLKSFNAVHQNPFDYGSTLKTQGDSEGEHDEGCSHSLTKAAGHHLKSASISYLQRFCIKCYVQGCREMAGAAD